MEIPERLKKTIRNDVGEYLKEQIVASAESAKSPVMGESFDPLSPQYKKKKIAAGKGGKPNLRFEGELLGDLTWEDTKDGIDLGWFGSQAAKADGHANLSGDSPLPQRRLIPGEGQQFRARIQRGIESIIADHLSEAGLGEE